MSRPDIEVATFIESVHPADGGRERIRLAYYRSDPLAVSLICRDREGEFQWKLARDLVDEGVRVSVGLGDVRVWPWSSTGTAVALSSPDGCATFVVLTEVLVGFLRRTYRLVPRGREDVGVDEAIARMRPEVSW